jgi:hypothetical protein
MWSHLIEGQSDLSLAKGRNDVVFSNELSDLNKNNVMLVTV